MCPTGTSPPANDTPTKSAQAAPHPAFNAGGGGGRESNPPATRHLPVDMSQQAESQARATGSGLRSATWQEHYRLERSSEKRIPGTAFWCTRPGWRAAAVTGTGAPKLPSVRSLSDRDSPVRPLRGGRRLRGGPVPGWSMSTVPLTDTGTRRGSARRTRTACRSSPGRRRTPPRALFRRTGALPESSAGLTGWSVANP